MRRNVPSNGVRFTCTSVTFMKTEMRVRSPSTVTARTCPSAGETMPGPVGRSGSRKKPAKNPQHPAPRMSKRRRGTENGSARSPSANPPRIRRTAPTSKGRPAPGANTRLPGQDDLDVDAVRDLDPHHLAQGALVGREVDEALVDAHLPVVDRARAAAVGSLAYRYFEALGREGDGPGDLDPGLGGDLPDLFADRVDLPRVRTGEGDTRLLHR